MQDYTALQHHLLLTARACQLNTPPGLGIIESYAVYQRSIRILWRHCNDTGYIICQMRRRYIRARIACGEYSGMSYYFPAFHCHRQMLASCHLTTSVSQTSTRRASNATPSHNLPSTNEGSPSWYRASREPRSPSSSILALSTVTAPVCRSYRKTHRPIARTRYTMCCCFRTAPTAFTWTSRRTAKRSRSPLWNTTVGDGCSATAGLNVVLCGDRLFQRYIVDDACAKMEQQRLNYLRFRHNHNIRRWRCSGEWRESCRSTSAQCYAYTLCPKKTSTFLFFK